jgi:hypothetical protein
MIMRGRVARLAALIGIGAGVVSLSLATPAMAASDHPTSQVAASSPAAATAANAACTVTVRGSGVRVRTSPHLNATVVALIQAGQHFTDPTCTATAGDKYTTCGITEDFWVHLIYQGVLRYAAAACFDGF